MGRAFDLPRYGFSELLSVDCQRGSRRNPAPVSNPHDERTQPTQFLLEQTNGGFEGLVTEGIRADELGQLARVMCLCATDGAHLEKIDVNAMAGELPRSLATGEPSADDLHTLHKMTPFAASSSRK
jgi:hypothetical protein